MTGAVWVTSTYPWVDQPVGGVFFQTQARALARLGADITVACPTPLAPWPVSRIKPDWGHYAHAPRLASDDGVAVIRPRYLAVPGEPGWAIPDRQMAQAIVRSRSGWAGAQVIHGHAAITGLAAWRLARRVDLPFVLTFHGSDLNIWPGRNSDRLPDLRTAIREAAAVFTVSPALAELVVDIADVEAAVLPIGSDHRALAAAALPRDEARRQLGVNDDRVVVLFVGNMLAAKGVRELVDAILALGDPFVGLFVGGGPETGYRSDDPQATGRIRYVGARPHDAVARSMSAADVLVLPSHREGLPTVLVEAGSLGLPVIASAVGGIPWLLGPDRGTILSEVSVPAIRAALTAFANDRPAAREAAGRLRTHVVHEHDVDRNAARLLETYESIQGRPVVQ